jgi:hypothetical protein
VLARTSSSLADRQLVWLRATGWTDGIPFPVRAEDFLFSTTSGPDLGPTELRNQWVSVNISLDVKRPKRVAGHPYLSSAKVKNDGAVPRLLVRLHGVVFN